MKTSQFLLSSLRVACYAFALTILQACDPIDIPNPEPLPFEEPLTGQFGVDITLEGRTGLFAMQGVVYAIPRYDSDTVGFFSASGDTLSDQPIFNFGWGDSLHICTTPNVVMLQGNVAFVIRELGDGTEPLNVALTLWVDDSIITHRRYHLTTSDISASLQFSTDTALITWNVGPSSSEETDS